MISEGSCDTDDWSNDCSQFNWNKLHFKMHFKIKRLLKLLNYDNISQYNFFAVLFFLNK